MDPRILTPRQTQAAGLVARGLSDKQIAGVVNRPEGRPVDGPRRPRDAAAGGAAASGGASASTPAAKTA